MVVILWFFSRFILILMKNDRQKKNTPTLIKLKKTYFSVHIIIVDNVQGTHKRKAVWYLGAITIYLWDVSDHHKHY